MTADLLRIDTLLHKVMQRQHIIMDQEAFICKVCGPQEFRNTIDPNTALPAIPAIEYVRTQQQLHLTTGGDILMKEIQQQPFHSKEQSDLALRAMIRVATRKEPKPMRLIKLKGKLRKKKTYKGFHNSFHANLREKAVHVATTADLLRLPISSLAVLSQVTQAESESEGLALVRRKRKKNRITGIGFSSLLGSFRH